MNRPIMTKQTREGARYEAMMLLRYACERNAMAMLLNTKRPLYRLIARAMERGAILAALNEIERYEKRRGTKANAERSKP